MYCDTVVRGQVVTGQARELFGLPAGKNEHFIAQKRRYASQHLVDPVYPSHGPLGKDILIAESIGGKIGVSFKATISNFEAT